MQEAEANYKQQIDWANKESASLRKRMEDDFSKHTDLFNQVNGLIKIKRQDIARARDFNNKTRRQARNEIANIIVQF